MVDFLVAAASYVVPFLLVLTLVVTVHELGHFTAARAFGVKIEQFSIGFGRALASWRDKSGVEWRLGWMPLGGYVKFAGDANAASVPDADDLDELKREIVAREGAGAEKAYFHFKPVWQRAIIVAAGPVSNFILAIAIFAFLTLLAGQITYVNARVGSVEPGSPAAAAGFQPGDLVEKADGRPIESFLDLRQHVFLRAGEPIRFEVDRAGSDVVLVATPQRATRVDPITGDRHEVGFLGLGQSMDPADLVTVTYGPVEALAEGVNQTADVLDTTLTYLGRIVTGRESGDQLGGPIGIARASGSVAAAAASAEAGGLLEQARNIGLSLLALSAFLSVGLGFLNLLPVPILDGGHLLFYAYEAVARRPLHEKIQAAGYRVGLALLLGLMLFATWNDLKKLPLFQQIGGLLS